MATPTQIIQKELRKLGETVREEAEANSRKSKDRFNKEGQMIHEGGTLKASIQDYAKGKKLTMSQIYYGQYQKPNELAVSIAKHVPETVNLIAKNLITNMLNPYKKK